VSKAEKKNNRDLSFEAALEKLESIVENMEKGDVPLADLIARYEEGSQLLKLCEKRLRDAELKIELLKEKQGEEPEFSDFDPDREESAQTGQ